MTPKRTVTRGSTPQRFTPRAGSRLPGSVRRALDGHIDSTQRNGATLEVGTTGRLEVKAAPGGGLTQTKQGLKVDPVAVGDKNHAPIDRQQDLLAASLSTTQRLTQLEAAANALYAELRRTGRMRT